MKINRSISMMGNQNANRKLDESQVREIRRRIELRKELIAKANQHTYSRLSESFGVHPRTIEKIAAVEIHRSIGDRK